MKTMTKTMKAMAINEYGDSNVIKSYEIPIPSIKNNLLLVKVHATSVNPIDYKIRNGWRNTGVEFPHILGFDVSGIVETIGENVKDFKSSDEVFYMPKIIGWQGAYAEYHLVEEEIVCKKPVNLSHTEAAAIPLAGCTAWDALIERMKIQLGETILIHAGAGGVGSLAIQLAKICGAYVFATTSSTNTDFVKKLGADFVIDYKKEDFSAVILKETKNLGVDAVFDTVGHETFTRSLDTIKPFGRIATIVSTTASIEKAFSKNITVHPVFVQSGRKKLEVMKDLIERGQLKPVIDSIISLKDVVKAHDKLEVGGVRGKIVVKIVD